MALNSEDAKFLSVFSRVVSYYLRKFDAEVLAESSARVQPPLYYYLDYARHMTDTLRKVSSRLLRNG